MLASCGGSAARFYPGGIFSTGCRIRQAFDRGIRGCAVGTSGGEQRRVCLRVGRGILRRRPPRVAPPRALPPSPRPRFRPVARARPRRLPRPALPRLGPGFRGGSFRFGRRRRFSFAQARAVVQPRAGEYATWGDRRSGARALYRTAAGGDGGTPAKLIVPRGNFSSITPYSFQANTLAVKAGDKVSLSIANCDTTSHSFAAPSLGISTADKVSFAVGATGDVTFTAPTKPGTYMFWCANQTPGFPTHAAFGMTGVVIVS